MVAPPRVRSTERRERGPARVAGVRAYHQGKALAGLFAMGAAALAVVLAIWAMPWVPVGMTWDDYSAHVLVALVLAMGSILMALIAAFTRGPASGHVQLAEIWHSLLGKRVRLRDRQQFCNRLARECQRAQRERRSSLSLILVRVSEGEDRDGEQALEHVAHALMAAMRSSDVVGMAGDNEIGILAIGADAKAREVISVRLKRALAAALVEFSDDRVATNVPEALLGASSWGPDGAEPDSLLMAARASFAPVVPRSRKAA
jgi:hypothetical protein